MPASQISFASFARSYTDLAAQSPSTPPVQQTAVVVVAHPLAVGSGGCIYRLRARFFSSCRFLALSHITTAAIASPDISTTATVTTASVTCSICSAPWLYASFIVACCLLALVLFHLVIVPAMDWVVERYS